MTMRRISLLAIALGLLIPASADAGFAIRLTDTDTGETVLVRDNDLPAAGTNPDQDALLGGIAYTGGVGTGVWTFTVTSATSDPLVGTIGTPELGLNIRATSSGMGELLIEVTDTDFGPTSFDPSLIASLEVDSASDSTDSISYNAYTDTGNTEFAQTDAFLALPLTITGDGDASGTGSAASDDNFSMTMVLTLNHDGTATSQFDAAVTTVPGPSGLLLFASGCPLFGLGLLRRRRRQVA